MSCIRSFSLPLIIASFVSIASAQAVMITSQVTSPTTGPADWDETLATQTGSIGGTSFTVTSTNTPWRSTFNDESNHYGSGLYETLAVPGGVGDFFALQFNHGQTDTITIVFNGPVLDPVFYIGDLDIVNSTLTIQSGWTSRSDNSDATWSGNTYTTTAGSIQNAAGAFAAVQYSGLYDIGDSFQFILDFGTNTPSFSVDTVGIGISATQIQGRQLPEPLPLAILSLGLIGLGALRSRRP